MENSEMQLRSRFKNFLKMRNHIKNHNINSFLKLNTACHTGSRANQFESEKWDHKSKKEQLRMKREIPHADWKIERNMELEFGEDNKRDFETISNKEDEDIRVKYPRLKEVVDSVRSNNNEGTSHEKNALHSSQISEERNNMRKKEQLRRQREIAPDDDEIVRNMEFEFGEAYKQEFKNLSKKGKGGDDIRVNYPRLKEVVDSVLSNNNEGTSHEKNALHSSQISEERNNMRKKEQLRRQREIAPDDNEIVRNMEFEFGEAYKQEFKNLSKKGKGGEDIRVNYPRLKEVVNSVRSNNNEGTSHEKNALNSSQISEERDNMRKKGQLRRESVLEFGEAYNRDSERKIRKNLSELRIGRIVRKNISHKEDEVLQIKNPPLKEVMYAVRSNNRTTVSFGTGNDVSLNQLGIPSLIRVRTVQEINSLPCEIFQRLLTTADNEEEESGHHVDTNGLC